jgi:ribosomal protein S4
MSWNKFNLYNLVRRELPPQTGRKTLYQQRWEAKRLTRGYHGDHITERQWQRLFNAGGRWLPTGYAGDTNSPSMVGSSSGRTQSLSSSVTRGSINNYSSGLTDNSTIPSLTFAELERRLEVAVFRCLFAPSVMAAHQMIRHGAVQVNEKKASITH